MANRRLDPVSYRPFRVEPTLAEGLLAVPREGGELERKVAMGMARLADEAGEKADRQAARAGALAGARDGLAGAPTADVITGGEVTGTASVNGQAGHVVGADLTPTKGIRVHSKLPAGMRNNNPGNIKYTGTGAFPGVVGPSVNRDQGDPQAVFETAEAGMHAMFSLAKRKYDGGKKSTNQLIAANMGWTPGNYQAAANVARTMGVGPDDDINLNDPASAAKFMRALMLQEHGPASQMYTDSMITSAIGGGEATKPAAQPAGQSFSTLPSAASVAPISVTPVRTPVTVEKGKAGTFQPSGRDTVYGRAYDVAGTRTYLEMADAAMVENQSALFDAYGDNPAMLEKALGEGLTADLRDNVIDEIAPEYTVAYRKRAAALMSKAKTAEKERELQVNRASFLNRAEDLETQRAQKLAGLDPNDPAAASDLAGLQSSIDAHYDSAVARGVIDADDAAEFKRRSRSDMTVGFYVGQAKNMPADKIDSMRTEMQKHFAAGELEGVTAGDWAEIDKGLTSAASTRRTQDATATTSLKQRGDEIVNKIARGQAVAPDERTRFLLDIGTATKGKEIAASTFARMRVADALRKQPIGEVERNLADILKGGGDTVNPEDTEFARKTIAEFRQAVLTDPLGKAEAIGLIPPVASIPVDGSATPEQIASAVAYRRGAADAVAKHFGISPRYFRPGEADAVMKAAEQNPEALVVFTQSVRDAFGRDAGRALSEFSESGPALAHAAGLSIATGDVGIARDVATTLTMKKQKQLPDLTPETGRKLSGFGANAIAGAFLADPRTQNAALQTAQLLFEQEAARQGIDPAEIKSDGSPAQTAYLKSLDRALGGRIVNGEEYGGVDEVNGFRIVTPSDMPKGEPQRLVENITDDELKALPPIQSANGYPVTANQIRRSQLVSAGDGLYRVALGDPTGDEPRYLTRQDGSYWTLDIRALAAVPRTNAIGRPSPGAMGDLLLWGQQ